jgi:t-SNARE complex subunit (syntaxin)
MLFELVQIKLMVLLVKLNATSEEVDIAVNDINNFRGTIYAEAVSFGYTTPVKNSNVVQMPSPAGLGELRLASREAQERHTEIARIVKTISELAHLILEVSRHAPGA